MLLKYLSARRHIYFGSKTTLHVVLSRTSQSNDVSGDGGTQKSGSRHLSGGDVNLTVKDGVLFQVMKSCGAMLQSNLRACTVQRNYILYVEGLLQQTDVSRIFASTGVLLFPLFPSQLRNRIAQRYYTVWNNHQGNSRSLEQSYLLFKL